MSCPCCTDAKIKPGQRQWHQLCDDCLGHVMRLSTCPHEVDDAVVKQQAA